MQLLDRNLEGYFSSWAMLGFTAEAYAVIDSSVTVAIPTKCRLCATSDHTFPRHYVISNPVDLLFKMPFLLSCLSFETADGFFFSFDLEDETFKFVLLVSPLTFNFLDSVAEVLFLTLE